MGFEPTTSAVPVQCSTNELSKAHVSGRIRISPLYVDVILGSSIVKSEINFVHIVAIEWHRHRRGRGFESRSEPDFFHVSVLVVLRPHLH